MSFHPLFEGGLCQTCRVSPVLSLDFIAPSLHTTSCRSPEKSTCRSPLGEVLVKPSLATITPSSPLRAGAATEEVICSGTHTPASCSCNGNQATSDLSVEQGGPVVPGLSFMSFSLAARTGSSSCSTCMTMMAISPTAPCAVRGASCSCAATQAAAGELQTSRVGETQQGPEAPTSYL